MGVFHLQSPRKKYDFTYEQAQRACAAEGASLATFRQLSAAQQVSGVGARCPFACWCFLSLQRKQSWGQQWAALPKAFAFGKKKLLSLVYVASFSSPEGDQVMVAFIQ